MKGNLKKVLESLSPGDLICCEWSDASVGKSLGSGMAVDVPVKSWGVFIGVLGEKTKHVVLAQNSFRYADGLFDIDYTAIPLTWHVNITVLAKSHVPANVAESLFNSFLRGGRRLGKSKIYQQRTSVHG